MKYKILIVEDDEDISNLLKYNFVTEGYDVEICEDGLSVMEKAKSYLPDIMLLDIMLPKLDGTSVIKMLRQNNLDFPVLFVSAKSMEIDKVLGLELGADDYITKPFSIAELNAKVKAFLRRASLSTKTSSEILKGGNIILDKIRHMVKYGKEEIDIRPKEFAILELLMEHKGKVFSRDVIAQRIWKDDNYVDDGTIDVHIRRLRMKIDPEDQKDKHIITIRGIGYKFNDNI